MKVAADWLHQKKKAFWKGGECGVAWVHLTLLTVNFNMSLTTDTQRLQTVTVLEIPVGGTKCKNTAGSTLIRRLCLGCVICVTEYPQQVVIKSADRYTSSVWVCFNWMDTNTLPTVAVVNLFSRLSICWACCTHLCQPIYLSTVLILCIVRAQHQQSSETALTIQSFNFKPWFIVLIKLSPSDDGIPLQRTPSPTPSKAHLARFVAPEDAELTAFGTARCTMSRRVETRKVFVVQMRRLSDGNKDNTELTLVRHMTLSNLRSHFELVPACVSLW